MQHHKHSDKEKAAVADSTLSSTSTATSTTMLVALRGAKRASMPLACLCCQGPAVPAEHHLCSVSSLQQAKVSVAVRITSKVAAVAAEEGLAAAAAWGDGAWLLDAVGTLWWKWMFL